MHPDVVLVHGDTSTTFVTALACFYLQIPVGHVEARTPYLQHLFSVIRKNLTVRRSVSSQPIILHRQNCQKQNLLKEGKNPDTIYVTGNTAIDALKTTVAR